jgi:drug/metabolite transporter (DMT)-like permease
MTGSEVLAIAYGLASAAAWGAGDFSGGIATKRSSVYSVILVSQLIGCTLLVVLALILAESVPRPGDWLLGAAAGLCGVLGMIALYTGLARYHMGVVAPVAAVVTAALPVVVGLAIEGLPSTGQLLGFGVALVAVWLLSRGKGNASFRARELALPVAAGMGFGLFFVLVDRVCSRSLIWPLVAARLSSMLLLAVLLAVRRQDPMPAPQQLPLIALNGILDTAGNAFFALAARTGRLDIAAVIASLYPAATVLLAWLILKERLARKQWLGAAGTLVALVLIAL